MANATHTKKRSRKYREKAELITKEFYPAAEGMELLPKLSTSSFDATVEAHIHINADTTQADQLVRTTVNLPHGTGKTVRVAAFVPDDLVDEAKKAGAVKAGNEELIKEVEAGKIEFDAAVAAPAMMKELGKIAKTLGQKGLMPNPKAGTVTDKIGAAVEELVKGRIECKMDKLGIIHVPFGKASFGSNKLFENFDTLHKAIIEAQPAGIKGIYIKSISVAPSMGPGLKIELTQSEKKNSASKATPVTEEPKEERKKEDPAPQSSDAEVMEDKATQKETEASKEKSKKDEVTSEEVSEETKE